MLEERNLGITKGWIKQYNVPLNLVPIHGTKIERLMLITLDKDGIIIVKKTLIMVVGLEQQLVTVANMRYRTIIGQLVNL